MSLKRLDQSCKAALPECEHLLHKAGLTIMAGGELEWYALLPQNEPLHMTSAQMADNFVATVKANPELLMDMRVHAGSFAEIRGIEQAKDRQDTKEAERLAILRAEIIAEREIRHASPLVAAVALLKLHVADRMQRAGIGLHNAEKEDGGFENLLTVVDHDGTQYQATGQQMEVSLGMSSPSQQVTWLENVRSIIKQESHALGMKADFRSRPPYTALPASSGIPSLPPNSMHIHYGLRFTDTNENAFISPKTKHNKISEACNTAALFLLKTGGQLLANHSENDFERIRDRDRFNTVAHEIAIGADKGADYRAVRTCDESRENTHKEIRIAGSGALPSAAMLLAVLSATDGILHVMAKSGQEKTISEIAATINDADHAQLQREKQMPGRYPAYLGVEEAATSFAEAKTQLTPDSDLAHYVPDVFAALGKIKAVGKAR